MADKKISEATADDAVGGGEKIPVDDGGSAKFATTAQIKDYVLAQIAALTAASGVSVSDDSVYILKGGALKPVTAATLAAAIMNEAFGRAAVVGPNGNEVIAIKDSDTRKTITFTALKTWLQSNMTVTPDLTLSTAGAAGTLGDSDLALVVQAASGKKVTLATLKDYVLGKLAAYVAACTAAQSVTTSDVIYIVQGGVARKATVAQLMATAGGGDVTAPSAHVAGNIPAWDDTAKRLTTGYGVASQVASTGASATKVPTEAAVREAINTAVTQSPSAVTASGANTAGNIPQWGANNTLTGGKSVQTSVRNAANASNDAVPTEKAVRDALDGFVSMPSSHVENAIPTWGSGSELKAGMSVVPSTTGIASADNASDEKIPTEKAVRAILPVAATTSTAGLMSAADKAKLNNMVDTTAVEEVGDAGLGDSDVMTVLKGGTTWKKSLLTRLWTWLMGKLPSFKLDAFAAPEDNENLNASTSAHGLCPKLSGNTEHFLRGDGTFAVPSGSDDFTGDSGSGGVHGLVPAPASGDAGDNKFLSASGTWAVPPSAAGVDIPGSTAIDALAEADAFYVYDASASGYRKVTAAQVRALVSGTKRYDTIFVPAGAMTPSADNGATPGAVKFTNTTHDTLAFPATADKGAEFSVAFPEDWDKSSVKVKLLWTYYDSTAGEEGQHVKFVVGAVSYADGEDISVAPTTTVDVTDQAQSANECCKTAASAALTLEGTVGNGNLVHFSVTRDADYAPAGGDALPTEALLLGAIVQFGRTADYTGW